MFGCSFALAIATAGASYSLADLIDRARQHSDLLLAEQARQDADVHAAAQARAWPNPSLSASLGMREELAERGLTYGAEVWQALPIAGKLGLRGDLAALAGQAWRVRQEATVRTLALDVIRLAYTYALARARTSFVERRQERLELMRAYLAGRVFASPQARAQNRLVELRLQRLVTEGIDMQARSRSTLALLRAYVPVLDDTPAIEVPWLPGGRALDPEPWRQRLQSANVEIALQHLRERSAELESALAAREAWPEPAMGAFFNRATAGLGETEAGLLVGVDLPFWNRNRAGVESARHRAIATSHELKADTRRLDSELMRTMVDYEAARQSMLKYPRTLLAELDSEMQKVEPEFRKGRVDLLTFLELDSEVAETFDRILAAQLNLVATLMALLALAGSDDPLAEIIAVAGATP